MKRKIYLSGIVIITLFIINLIYPRISNATDEVTITINDENLYNAMAEKFEDEITSNGENTDGTYYITMSQDDIDSTTSLDFSSCEITDITGLENFTSLTRLYLGSNNITDITAIENLTSLTSLSLGANNITDITPISDMVSLTTLNLYSNSIVDISAIANLTNLTDLNLMSNNIEDMTVLEEFDIDSFESLYCSGQTIYTTASDYEEIALPEIFIQAQNSESILYYGDDGSLSTYYCTVSDSGDAVTVNSSTSEVASVHISGGYANTSYLYITFENYMEFPSTISGNGSGSMTINYDGDYTMYYQAIEIDDSDSIVDYDNDDWIESSDSSFTIDSSTYTGTKYFVLWIKLVTSDGTYYGRSVYKISGTYSSSSSSSSSTSSSSSDSNSDSSSESSDSESSDDSEDEEDTTTTSGSLPYTGKTTIMLMIIISGVIFMIAIFYKKYHYYKDV